jgi:hypothetical protein
VSVSCDLQVNLILLLLYLVYVCYACMYVFRLALGDDPPFLSASSDMHNPLGFNFFAKVRSGYS